MKKIILCTFLYLCCLNSNSQYYEQYFDGADTSASNSVIVYLDTSATNIWQIGPPQKVIFNSASTNPNVLVTDTINTYPDSLVSSFTFSPNLDVFQSSWIMGIQWNQKLDMDTITDGGIIEFSVDTGNTWQNAFNNPNVYNFYGWNPPNYNTLESTGEFCFTGTDSQWRNIWFCFTDSYLFRRQRHFSS